MDKLISFLTAYRQIILTALLTGLLVIIGISAWKWNKKNPLMEKKPTSEIPTRDWRAIDLTDENNVLIYIDDWFTYNKFRYVLEDCIPNKKKVEDCHK